MGLTAAVASLAKALPLHKTGSNVHVHVIIIVVVVVVVFVVSMAASGSSVHQSVHLAGTCFIVILQAFFINYSLLLFDKRPTVGATCILYFVCPATTRK